MYIGCWSWKKGMIGIELIIQTSNIDDLGFLGGLQTKNFKVKQIYVHSCILWVGLKDLETWLTLEDTSKFQEGQEWRIKLKWNRGTYHSQLKKPLLDGILSYGRLPNSHLILYGHLHAQMVVSISWHSSIRLFYRCHDLDIEWNPKFLNE